MALIPRADHDARVAEAFDFALTRFAADRDEKAALREQLRAAGLPDDQVPPAPVDDAEVVAFLQAMRDLTPQPGVPEGEDVLPDVDTLPAVPDVGGNEPLS